MELLARVRSQLRRYLQLGGGAVRETVLCIGGIGALLVRRIVEKRKGNHAYGHCLGDESAVGGFVGKELGESLQVLQFVLEPLLLCIAFCEQAQCLDVVGLQDVGALQAGDGFGVTLLVHHYLSLEQEHWG